MFLAFAALPLADIGPIIGAIVWAVIILGAIAGLMERRRKRDQSVSLEAKIRDRAGRPTHWLGEVVLTVDPERLVITNPAKAQVLRVHQLDPSVKASVDVAGNISVTRCRNLAKKAVAGAIIPGAIFVAGNAKETVHDHRELYLVVEADTWAEVQQLDPNLGAEARRFAQQINLAARGDRVPRPATGMPS